MEPATKQLLPLSDLTLWQRVRGYAVHVYTASGVGLAFLAAAEICAPAPDPRHCFILLFAAVFVDATDGFLARRWHVKALGGGDRRAHDRRPRRLPDFHIPAICS